MKHLVRPLAASALALALSAFGATVAAHASPVASDAQDDPAPPAPPAPPSSPAPAPAPAAPAASEAAKAVEAVAKAYADARAANDAAKLAALTKDLLPTSDDVRKVLKTGAATDAFVTEYRAERLIQDANEVAKEILKPKDPAQTVVAVHSATTEELAAYVKGSVASNEFPGGLQRFAQSVAAPGRTWHVVEHVEPGKDAGMKYSVFTVLDGRVVFLLKPWRALPK